MNRSKLPTIIGILILVIGVVAGVFLIGTSKTFKLGASPDVAPQDVRITNVSDKSFTVSWITDKPTIGYLEYGTSDSLGQTTTADAVAANAHFVQVTSLNAASSYFFKVNSAGKLYDNSGIAWNVKTGQSLQIPSTSQVISGSVVNATGQPAAGVIVYVTPAGGAPLSAFTSATGSWVVSVSDARTVDLSGYLTLVPDSTLIQIFVQGGQAGIATAQVFPKSANPVPQIKLGQTQDFRNESPLPSPGEVPQSNINLPQTSATGSSGFKISTPSGTPAATTSAAPVTLASVDPGETITTTKPEFFGGGPPGTTITITVQSNPITANVLVDPAGQWSWNIPSNLAPGNHTVTITWKDVKGVLQSLTRNFVVQAAEGPAFVSTPSATLKPITTPIPTPISTSSGTSRVVLPGTGSAIPVSGTLTPTWIVSIMGIGLITISFVIWKKEN